MRSPVSAAVKATSTMETATVEPAYSMGAAKARLSARRKASDISAVIKATERTGARSGLVVRKRGPMESWISASGSASVECVAMIKIAAVGIEVVAINDRTAVGDVSVVVVNCGATVPIIIPVMPAPPKSSEKADSKSTSEVN